MTTDFKPTDLVVFQEYDEAQIARAGGYSVGTVYNIKTGSAALTKAFRLRVAGGLQRPEAELFALARREDQVLGEENEEDGNGGSE